MHESNFMILGPGLQFVWLPAVTPRAVSSSTPLRRVIRARDGELERSRAERRSLGKENFAIITAKYLTRLSSVVSTTPRYPMLVHRKLTFSHKVTTPAVIKGFQTCNMALSRGEMGGVWQGIGALNPGPGIGPNAFIISFMRKVCEAYTSPGFFSLGFALPSQKKRNFRCIGSAEWNLLLDEVEMARLIHSVI
ncbi:hypothetical protein BDD12DRAFT_521310 [Trichophaea hybrida]|nr:hypothetical protein BDD12DRAFT_521310 [Trichophaea hybrida]